MQLDHYDVSMLRSRVRWISAHERTLNIHPSIMHVLVLIIINLHTKFEVPCFTHSKDMIVVPKFNKSPLPLTNPREAVPQAPLCCTQMSTVSVINCDLDRHQFTILTMHLS